MSAATTCTCPPTSTRAGTGMLTSCSYTTPQRTVHGSVVISRGKDNKLYRLVLCTVSKVLSHDAKFTLDVLNHTIAGVGPDGIAYPARDGDSEFFPVLTRFAATIQGVPPSEAKIKKVHFWSDNCRYGTCAALFVDYVTNNMSERSFGTRPTLPQLHS